jgi:hypothetical protein
MKTTMFFVAVALGAAARAANEAPSTNTWDFVTIQTNLLQRTEPLARSAVIDKYRIERDGNLSSRPWTEIVGWHPGSPSGFLNARPEDTGWPLLWFGAAPRR